MNSKLDSISSLKFEPYKKDEEEKELAVLALNLKKFKNTKKVNLKLSLEKISEEVGQESEDSIELQAFPG